MGEEPAGPHKDNARMQSALSFRHILFQQKRARVPEKHELEEREQKIHAYQRKLRKEQRRRKEKEQGKQKDPRHNALIVRRAFPHCRKGPEEK